MSIQASADHLNWYRPNARRRLRKPTVVKIHVENATEGHVPSIALVATDETGRRCEHIMLASEAVRVAEQIKATVAYLDQLRDPARG